MKYCSNEHQVLDWQTHKLLCKSLATFQERPRDDYRRAIVFPEDSNKPRFKWILTGAVEDLAGGEGEQDEEQPNRCDEHGSSLSSSADDQREVSLGNAGNEHDNSLSNASVYGVETAMVAMSSVSRLDEASLGVLDKLSAMDDEIGWEDARANPTGYEYAAIQDESIDGQSDTSDLTNATSVDPEEYQVHLRWRGSCNLGGPSPNQCVTALTNDMIGNRFKGDLLVYGVDGRGFMVDLDTTLLTLAIDLLLFMDGEQFTALFKSPEEGSGSGVASSVEILGVAASEVHEESRRSDL